MRLYEANETEFNHNGFGVLSDAADAEVTEERNGAFELTMQYPSGGWLFSELKNRRIIYCPAYPGGTPQPFRIYRITKPMGGLVTVYAEHISYDLSGVMLSRFSAGSAAEAFAKLPQYAVGNNPFTFFTDKSTQAVFQVTAPASIRSKLGGSEGSLLDVYGGEYVFDGFTVKLLNERGQNRGVSIRYGKNLTDLTQEENIQSVYTGVYPYWAKEEDYFELPEKTVNAEGDFGFTRLMPLDLSSEFEEKPSAEQLRAKAQEYMKANKIGVPKVSLTVSFFPLEQSEEYKDLALLETVYLCDTVNVEFSALGVSATAKVVKTVYDVLRKRYRSIELGDAKSNIADTIVKQEQEIQKKPSYSALEDAIKNATNWITNGGGYIVAVKDEAGNWKEIVSLDVNNLEQAKKVWRWNNGGFGFSATGYNGPYRLAITQDGAIVADFITVGTLTANIIKAGILAAANGKSFWNLDTGEIVLDGTFTAVKGDYLLKMSAAALELLERGKRCLRIGDVPGDFGGGLEVTSPLDDVNTRTLVSDSSVNIFSDKEIVASLSGDINETGMLLLSSKKSQDIGVLMGLLDGINMGLSIYGGNPVIRLGGMNVLEKQGDKINLGCTHIQNLNLIWYRLEDYGITVLGTPDTVKALNATEVKLK